MAKRGRPRKSGARSATDRLIQARDYGNLIVQARRALFDAQCIKGGKAADQVFDGIGQLWALDFLDGHHLDPELMRDTARKYAALYWRTKRSNRPENRPASEGRIHPRSADRQRFRHLFERWQDAFGVGSYEQQVLEHVTSDYWFATAAPDSSTGWSRPSF
jgi:hypothetical protein